MHNDYLSETKSLAIYDIRTLFNNTCLLDTFMVLIIFNTFLTFGIELKVSKTEPEKWTQPLYYTGGPCYPRVCYSMFWLCVMLSAVLLFTGYSGDVTPANNEENLYYKTVKHLWKFDSCVYSDFFCSIFAESEWLMRMKKNQ